MMRLLCRCPRCGGVLLRPIFGKVTSTPDICPHCGVSVDEPMRPGP
jgi:ribosomal protein S27AE